MKNLNFKTDILPFIIATAGEFVALYYWLVLMDLDKVVLANIVLWAGFFVERISVVLWLGYVYRKKENIPVKPLPLWQIPIGLVAITFTEILIWLIWVAAVPYVGHLLGGLILGILMLLEHSAEMGLVKRTNLLAFVTSPKTIFFTLMETLGAMGWLYFVRNDQPLLGGAILLIGLSVEHIIQGSELKPAETAVMPDTLKTA